MMSQLTNWWADFVQSMPNASICLLTLFLVLCSYYCCISYFKESFSWEKYGVTHVKIKWTTFTDFREGFTKLLGERGDTVGFYTRRPQLLTKNRDILKQILVKDFSNFVTRSDDIVSNSVMTKSLFFATGQRWKWKRQLLSPSFSTSKLKLITKIIREKAKRLSTHMADCAEKNQLAHVKQVNSHFGLEVIAQTAFGCQIDCLGSGKDNEFAFHCQNLLKTRTKFQRMLLFPVSYYRWLQVFLIKVLRIPFFDFFNGKAADYFKSLIQGVMNDRVDHIKDGKPVPMDFLQLFYNNSVMNEQSETKSEEKQMTFDDVMGELMLIIFAGFETTSTTLQFIFYFLAVHQDIQEKVFQEIQEKVKDDTPTHEEVSQLTYTKQVIDETLRLYPPAQVINRTSYEERKYGHITIPAKTKVSIPIFLIHRDPELYPNPDVFDPDRFSEEQVAQREPFSFMPFGGGPRLCLGMRLAYIQIKLALVYVLRKVKVSVNDRTSPPAGGSFKLGVQGFPIPVEAIQLSVELRKD